MPARICVWLFGKSIAEYLVLSKKVNVRYNMSKVDAIYSEYIKNKEEFRMSGISIIGASMIKQTPDPITIIAKDQQEKLDGVLVKNDRIHSFYHILYHVRPEENSFFAPLFDSVTSNIKNNKYEHNSKHPRNP